MAEGVVNLFETVQVEEQDRSARPVAGGLAQGLVGPVEEAGAVGKPREFVVHGLVHGLVEGFVHGLDRVGVVEGQTGMVRETDEDVAFADRVRPALTPGSDRQAADHPTADMDGGGHGGMHPVVGEGPERATRFAVALRYAQPVLDDGSSSDPGTDGGPAEAGEKLARHVDRRHHLHDAWFGLIYQPQAHHFVPQQLGCACGDRIEDFIE